MREVHEPNDPTGIDPDRKLNWNTLEAELLRANDFKILKDLLERKDESEASLLKHMESSKPDTALKLFEADAYVHIPKYIIDGIGWLDGQC